MIKKIIKKYQKFGFRGVFNTLYRRIAPLRSHAFTDNKLIFAGKTGLELGGLSPIFKKNGEFPVYEVASKIDNCNFSSDTTWEGRIDSGETFNFSSNKPPGMQYIAEATNLSFIESESYDFLLSSHVLEHIANPIMALKEWVRVIKNNGVLVLILPHKDGTFDHKRPVTELAHMIQDFENKVTEADLTHFEEIIELHDLSLDPEAGTREEFIKRSENNLENRCFHHHVFNTKLGVELVDYLGLKILSVEAFQPHNIVILAEKIEDSVENNNNKKYLDNNFKLHTDFKSDLA